MCRDSICLKGNNDVATADILKASISDKLSIRLTSTENEGTIGTEMRSERTIVTLRG